MTLTQIKPAGLSTPVDLADNARIRLGTGNDLQIYHDGSNSYIEDAGTGVLLIKSNTLYLTGTNAANDLASFVEGGAVSLYYDDVKKFETTSSGISVLGGGSTFLKLGNVAGATDSVFLDTTHASNAKPNMDFKLDGDLALRIDSSGNVGINDASPTAELSVAATAPHIDIGAAGGTRMKIGYEGNNCFFGGTASTAMFIFKQNVDLEGHPQASGTERMRIQSGGGISFNGDTAAANALDDYEEGTFSPSFTMTNGGESLTYSVQQGTYTKIGNTVFIEIYIAVTGINANGSGSLRVSGLPFTKTSGYGGVNISYLTNLNNVEITHALVDVSSTNIFLYTWSGSSVANASVAGSLTTSTQIMLNGAYRVP